MTENDEKVNGTGEEQMIFLDMAEKTIEGLCARLDDICTHPVNKDVEFRAMSIATYGALHLYRAAGIPHPNTLPACRECGAKMAPKKQADNEA